LNILNNFLFNTQKLLVKMKSAIYLFKNDALSKHPRSEDINKEKVQLVLCFGAKHLLSNQIIFDLLRRKFPVAHIAICSTAGEIYNTEVLDETITVSAIEFEHTTITSNLIEISDYNDSYEAGKALLTKFDRNALKYLLVLSDGSKVNGSELVRGLNADSNHNVLITGGLAGDGSDFQSTLVGLNDQPREGVVIAIGLYGDKIRVSHGSQGGWEMFGPERMVSKSKGNQLFEIDDKNALETYKKYLGPDADDLPGSALLFPLSVKLEEASEPIVRTILSIDENLGSMTFAGDIPEGSYVRFMKANFDKLTQAASTAAIQTHKLNSEPPKFALLVSCVGRKLILQSRIDEEVEAVDDIFDHKTLLAGFYSYGEISPFVSGNHCQLHNQTMTITTFHETE
jgi:hypothetical protein